MAKQSAKKRKRSKSKKKEQNKPSIRTDIWSLYLRSDQKKLALLTVEEYRHFLKPLILIAYWNWGDLSKYSEKIKVNKLEKLVHKTANNPYPKYYWFFHKGITNHPSWRKFPSYLRRAAIQDALGIVSSFVTRWEAWIRGERKHKYDSPPRLTSMCRSYPALYKGQQIRYYSNFQAIELKVWNGTDWVWSDRIKVVNWGKSRHENNNNKLLSPSLIANKRTVHLSVPVQLGKVKLDNSDYVCAVDIGINTTATCSIVGFDGTVKARKFIHPARDIDRRDQRKQRIATKSKQTSRITKEKLPRYFCKGLYRKSKNINEHIAQSVSKEIVEFALLHSVILLYLRIYPIGKLRGVSTLPLINNAFINGVKTDLLF